MTARKAIAKSVRFEVFKRDRFTCQYCGAKAPEAVLQVDHIHPVAEGGENEIMNLVTACVACNSGKSDRKLSDQSALEKQRAELEQLEERRQQLEMMMEWRKAAGDYQKHELQSLVQEIETRAGVEVTEYGRQQLTALRRRFEMRELLEAIDRAFSGVVETREQANDLFKKLAVYCNWARRYGEHGDRYAYIQAIVRNRFGNYQAKLIAVIHNAHRIGYEIDDIEDWARKASSINQFIRGLEPKESQA